MARDHGKGQLVHLGMTLRILREQFAALHLRDASRMACLDETVIKALEAGHGFLRKLTVLDRMAHALGITTAQVLLWDKYGCTISETMGSDAVFVAANVITRDRLQRGLGRSVKPFDNAKRLTLHDLESV